MYVKQIKKERPRRSVSLGLFYGAQLGPILFKTRIKLIEKILVLG